MKILMFGWEYPPHISGGLGTACLGLSKGLVSLNDINLTFVMPIAHGDEINPGMKIIGANNVQLSEQGLTTVMDLVKSSGLGPVSQLSGYISPAQYNKLSNSNTQNVFNQKRGTLNFTGQYGASLFDEIQRYAIVAEDIARKEDHDVIHAHDWLTYPAGIKAGKISDKPLIVHVHATEFDRCGNSHNETVYEIEQEGMRCAQRVITVSDYTRRIVIKKYGINPSRVITVHNAVNLTVENCSSDIPKTFRNQKIVTFLGRITWQKGPRYFIEAANKVLKRMDNVHFVMAGDGDMLEGMIEYVTKLKIAKNFHFTGFLKGNDVSRMLRMSDLYIMPSVSEPFGIAPLEAIQNNVPVIISKQSGVSEVIDGAIKVDFWDTDAMADAIYGILKYPSLSCILKKKSREELDKLKWEEAALKIREIYKQIA